MAIGAAVAYNKGILHLIQNATPDWDDGAANFTFALLDTTYTPANTHALWSDVSLHQCDDADYAPKAVTTRAATESSGNVYLDSDDANFGAAVTISARYLVCVQTASAGVLAPGDKLVFYVDLNTGASTNVSSSASTFNVQAPTNGWLRLARSA
jgi:hypothetical protein